MKIYSAKISKSIDDMTGELLDRSVVLDVEIDGVRTHVGNIDPEWSLDEVLDYLTFNKNEILKNASPLDESSSLETEETKRNQSFLGNLPSWTAVSTACDNISSLAEAKAFLKKMARVICWLAKDSEE